ncbi:transposase [Streptococcus pyogenes]|nr:transposase [Streptococcus pyogenes]VGQ80276.1 transposase [Streptococcus pyogenes]VGV14263.1 transposase [Streptococcus pyogenes]VHD67338.1 transposase [Streptococcus pyogenes]
MDTLIHTTQSFRKLDSLRVRKADKLDTEKLAQSQFILVRKPTYVQEEVYQLLRDLSRFYQNLTEDNIVRELRIAFTRSYKSLFLNWNTSYLHQLVSNTGMW